MKAINQICVATAAGLALLTGCANDSRNETYSRTEETRAVQKSSISITTLSRELLVGDTATFMANTANTYGRDAHVRWTTTAGHLTTDEGGRIARVRFDEAGAYTVKATLELDGNVVQTEAVDVRVRPVK